MKRSLWLFSCIAHVLLIGAIANPVLATDVFVSTSAQLKSACSNALSGNVIKIATGIYDGPFSISGKSHVTLQSYNGTVTLRGNLDPSIPGKTILTIANSSYININNLKFAESWGNNSNGISVVGSGQKLQITNCEFYNIGWGKSKTTMPTSSQNAHAIVIVGTTATAYSAITVTGNSIHDCITGYSESLTLAGNITNFTIQGNTLHDNTNIGIDCAGHYSWTGAPSEVNYAREGSIKDNKVYNYAGPANLPAGAAIYVDGGSAITIGRNKVYNYKVGISIGCENSGKSSTNNIVRDNIVYNASLSGIFVGSSTNSIVSNTRITNNTFYKNGFGAFDNGQIALLNNTNTIIKNNILYPTNGRWALVQMSGTTSSNLLVSYNLYYRDNGDVTNLYFNVSGGSNAIKSNPLFVNAPIDLHVKQTSPVINRGDPGFVPASGETDLDLQARVLDSRVDIGVDEVALTVPKFPTSLTVQTISYAMLKLNWLDNSNNELGFKIERSKGSSTFFTQIGTVGVNVRSFTDNGLAASTKYNYRVRAYNTAGNSSYTTIASGTTTGILITAMTPSKERLSSEAIRVYPNPTTDQLKLEYHSNNTGGIKLKVFDIAGKLVFEQIEGRNELSNIYTLKLNNLLPGLYVLSVNDGADVKQLKFSVIKD